MLEPSEPQLPDGLYGDLDSQAAELREKRFIAPATGRADNPFRRPSVASQARQAASTGARTVLTTDYGYVVGELKRIFGTAAVVVLILVAVAIFHG